MQQRPNNTDQLAVAGDNELIGSIEDLVNQRLGKQCPHRFNFKDVTYHYSRGTLTLRGRLPSFYLKQVLQTLLCDIEGVELIDNQVDVDSSTGLGNSGRE